MRKITAVLSLHVALGLAWPALAQWSHNPAANLGISVGGSDQNQPKIAPTSDGGCYIVWLDGIGTGWDTRLQRLDSRGLPQLGPNGILVADTGFSSTQDYGFAVDADDNAVIAYRDDANNGSPVHIKVQKVSPAGLLLWGSGVQVSTVTGGNAPHACVTTDGGVVAGWSEGANAKLQKLDASGSPQWIAGGIVDVPGAGSYAVSEVQPGDNGSVIAAYVKGTQRHLYTQKFDSAGNKLWNAGNPVIVFDGSALQFGYFPTFLPDGAGGAVFGWYETGGTRNVYVQRITSAGAELFPHNGVPVSTNTASGRLSPWIDFDQATGDTYCFWTDVTLPVQSQWGLSGQKITAAGARAWGDAAITFVPFSAMQNSFVRVSALASGGGGGRGNTGGAIVSYFDQPGAAAHIRCLGVDSAGATLWTPTEVDLCSVDSGKARLSAVANADGTRVFATWADSRGGANDIFAQAINIDGSLGTPGDVNDDGLVDVNDLLAVINGWGACPVPPAFCAADLTPAPIGNGQINVDDLLKVINNWDT